MSLLIFVSVEMSAMYMYLHGIKKQQQVMWELNFLLHDHRQTNSGMVGCLANLASGLHATLFDRGLQKR